MKKLYTLLVIALIGYVGKAQIVNIPDANFKAKLLEASPSNQIASTQTPDINANVTTFSKIDTNDDGEIQVSEALAIKWLSVRISSISDLTGIESFTNLITLSVIPIFLEKSLNKKLFKLNIFFSVIISTNKLEIL
jgi:hypothetical protein